jgi:hypothetical protein
VVKLPIVATHCAAVFWQLYRDDVVNDDNDDDDDDDDDDVNKMKC